MRHVTINAIVDIIMTLACIPPPRFRVVLYGVHRHSSLVSCSRITKDISLQSFLSR